MVATKYRPPIYGDVRFATLETDTIFSVSLTRSRCVASQTGVGHTMQYTIYAINIHVGVCTNMCMGLCGWILMCQPFRIYTEFMCGCGWLFVRLCKSIRTDISDTMNCVRFMSVVMICSNVYIFIIGIVESKTSHC